jgi:hypothetical protein
LTAVRNSALRLHKTLPLQHDSTIHPRRDQKTHTISYNYIAGQVLPHHGEDVVPHVLDIRPKPDRTGPSLGARNKAIKFSQLNDNKKTLYSGMRDALTGRQVRPTPTGRRAAMKNTMRGLAWMMVYSASIAYAAPTGEGDGVSMLGYLFLGFFALIIVSQLVPACLLFYGMVKGVFAGREEKAEVIE